MVLLKYPNLVYKKSVMKVKIKNFLPYIIILLTVFVYKCPIKMIFRIPCLGCGLTRAMISFVRLDLVGAFKYHPLFWLIGAELIYLIFKKYIIKKINIKPIVELLMLIITVILLIIVYIIRWKLGILPD